MFVPNVKDAQLSPLASPATTPCAPGRREAGSEPRRKAERRKQSSYLFLPSRFRLSGAPETRPLAAGRRLSFRNYSPLEIYSEVVTIDVIGRLENERRGYGLIYRAERDRCLRNPCRSEQGR